MTPEGKGKRFTPLRLEKSKPDAAWVAKLAHVPTKKASEYLSEAIEDSGFQAQLAETLRNGGRDNYVQISAPFELYALARLLKPGHIVEIGVSAGVSSAYFLKAIQRNSHGRLHSIDLPEPQIGLSLSPRKNSFWCLPPGRASGWAVPASLANDWDLRLGSSAELLPDLTYDLESVGLFLYDVPYTKAGAISDFQIVDKKLKAGSVIMADNCLAPLTWWAKKMRERVYQRRETGLRGFRVNNATTGGRKGGLDLAPQHR